MGGKGKSLLQGQVWQREEEPGTAASRPDKLIAASPGHDGLSQSGSPLVVGNVDAVPATLPLVGGQRLLVVAQTGVPAVPRVPAF